MKCFQYSANKLFLICDILIISFLYCDSAYATYTKNATNFSGTTRNITVYAVEDGNYLENNKSLKLNISWIPSSDEKEAVYSILITSLRKENKVNRTGCMEGFAFFTQNASQLSVLIPKNKLLKGMTELKIRPNCTYKIQLHTNGRVKHLGQLSEVNYTVPECVGRPCSCKTEKATLPIPKVEVIQTKKDVIINWNITSNNFSINSYVISVSMPTIISKGGHSVHHITKISNVTFSKNSIIWDSKIKNQYIKMKNGTKIFVTAIDNRGCSGTPGEFVIITTEKNKITIKLLITLFVSIGIFMSVISGCLFVIKRNKNDQLPWMCRVWRKQWPNLILQEYNVLYVQQKYEETYKMLEYDEFEVSYQSINFMDELGKGQFGKVYLSTLNNNKDTLVAIKVSVCSDASDEPETRRQMLEEIKTMKTAGSHPNLVKLIGYCTSPNNPICILLEYMNGKDLLTYLHSRRQFRIDETALSFDDTNVASRYIRIVDETTGDESHDTIGRQQFVKFALDIARGMEHLEAKGIVHRDLAARNILLTSDLTLKVSDFGLSRNGIYIINNTANKVRPLPLRWMSPEAIRDYTFSTKSDIWSYGIVLWEIATLGAFPYTEIQDDKLLQYLTQNIRYLSCPNTTSQDLYKIMCSCWNTVPNYRPSFTQLVLDLQMLKEPVHSKHEISNQCYTLLSH